MAETLVTLSSLLSQPESWLVQRNKLDEIKKVTRDLYGYAKSIEPAKFGALKTMIVDGFDAEAIWSQFELYSEPALVYFEKHSNRLLDEAAGKEGGSADLLNKVHEVQIPFMDEDVEFEENSENDLSDLNEENDGEEFQDESNNEESEGENSEMDEDVDNSNESKHDLYDDDSEVEEQTKAFLSQNKPIGAEKKQGKSIDEMVADKFFSIAKLHKITDALEDIEQPPAKKKKSNSKSNETDEEDDQGIDFDLYNDDNNDDEAAALKYSDFFDAPPTEEDEKAALEAEEIFDEVQTESVDVERSEYQKSQDALQETISTLEKEALDPKSWTLRGEVTAMDRPEDGILESHLDYEVAAKVAAPVTEETTAELETLIKQRIKDASFDDVIRKIDLKPRVYRPPVQVNSEKSKLGLAEIYAQDFLMKAEEEKGESKDSTKQEISKEHTVIIDLFAKLSYKLDALSNFHFTPRAPDVEISVRNNVPAIAMEEILPMAVNPEIALAPHEIYAPEKKGKNKGVIISESEQSAAERARIRKSKKAAFEFRKKDQLANVHTVERLNPLAPKDQLKKNKEKYDAKHGAGIKAGKNLKLGVNVDASNYTRSSEIFSKLADEQALIGVEKKKNHIPSKTANSLKL